jgi:hypothetical protein
MLRFEVVDWLSTPAPSHPIQLLLDVLDGGAPSLFDTGQKILPKLGNCVDDCGCARTGLLFSPKSPLQRLYRLPLVFDSFQTETANKNKTQAFSAGKEKMEIQLRRPCFLTAPAEIHPTHNGPLFSAISQTQALSN